jgi:hypothetical protein
MSDSLPPATMAIRRTPAESRDGLRWLTGKRVEDSLLLTLPYLDLAPVELDGRHTGLVGRPRRSYKIHPNCYILNEGLLIYECR